MSTHAPGLAYDIRRGNSTADQDRLADAAVDLLAACKALRAIIHDDLTHAEQAHHATEIIAADVAIARAEGGAP